MTLNKILKKNTRDVIDTWKYLKKPRVVIGLENIFLKNTRVVTDLEKIFLTNPRVVIGFEIGLLENIL